MALVELLQKSGDPVLTQSRGGAERPAPEQYKLSKKLVRVKGLEPPLPCGKQILSLPRLPFRHTRINNLAV